MNQTPMEEILINYLDMNPEIARQITHEVEKKMKDIHEAKVSEMTIKPLSMVDEIIETNNDEEWLKDVIFYLQCYIDREYEAKSGLFTKVYVNADPGDKAERIASICGDSEELKEVIDYLNEYYDNGVLEEND